MPRWTRLLDLSTLPPGSKRLVPADVGPAGSTAPTRLLAVHTDDALYVVDGRCPHEGYPLSDGLVSGCVLTCAWHNWKFDLETGANTLGGEGVRRWPSRVVDGHLEVDLLGPDPADEREERFASLSDALFKRRLGQALRDTLRLLVGGTPPAVIAAHVARHDALHARWGTTHTLPVAADCARLADAIDDPYEQIHRLAPMLDMAVDATGHLPLRERPTEADIAAAEADADALVAAVEAEDALGAEAILRAAHRDGVSPATIEAWLLRCTALHFTDFGHQLIYLQKLRELRLRLGDAADPTVLCDLAVGLVVGLAYATREDTLPYMRRWFGEPLTTDGGDLLDALRGGVRSEVLPALGAALERGDRAKAADELIVAGAWRAEQFDEALPADPTVDEDWLSATHRFTAALAVAELLDHVPCSDADAEALLRQGASFVSIAKATDRTEPAERSPVDASWCAPLLELLLDDRFARPIRLAHGVKTLVAAMDAQKRLPIEHRDAPVHAVRRYLLTPARERSLRGQVHEAVRWLRDGKPPRRLTR